MLRGSIWLLLAFAAAVVVALLLRANDGNVAILWPPYRVDLSSNMALVLTVLAFFVLHVLLLALGKALAMPQRIGKYRERRREKRSGRALQAAVLALFEGRYERAERMAAAAASTSGDGSDGVAAASLVAARSAHRLGAPDRRDGWLRQASAASRDNAAALMVQAEFALDDQQPARALEAVDRMTPGGAQQPIALEAALGAYQQSGRWDRVLDTVRLLSRRGRMSTAEAASLRLTAYRQLLAPREGDAQSIRELWKSLRAEERKAPGIAAPTVAALARAAAPDDARKVAMAVLDADYDEATVEAFGAMGALTPRQRLEQLERWRARHGDKPKLLEMLGRICASEKLWGKAEGYLLGSLASGDTVSARVALAQLYESIDRQKAAALQFQLAARLALGESPPLPAPVAATIPSGAIGTSGPAGGLTGKAAGASAGSSSRALDSSGLAGSAADAVVAVGTPGMVPAIARPDRQDFQDRVPPAGAIGAGTITTGTTSTGSTNGTSTGKGTLTALPLRSDAAPPVDLQAGAGDEPGLVGRKK